MIVYFPDAEDGTITRVQEFIFADAHRTDVSKVSELFKEDVIVKLIMDVTNSIAYVQNADTNAYLEGRFKATQDYVDSQVQLITEIGIPKLQTYTEQVVSTSEGQTEFLIGLSTFDKLTDSVFVQSGITILFPETDYTVTDTSVVLTEGVPLGRTIGIYIFKNVPIGEDGSVSGTVITKNSMPVDRLNLTNPETGEITNIVTSNVPMRVEVLDDGGVQFIYDDGKE